MCEPAKMDLGINKNQFSKDCEALRKSEISEESISGLVNLWKTFHDDLLDTDQNLECLLKCTARMVFNVNYSKKISSDSKKKLKDVIISCGNSMDDCIHTQKLLNGIGSIVENPWQTASFQNVVTGPKSKRIEAFNILWDTEGWIMLENRIDYLSKNGKKSLDQFRSILELLVEKGHTIFRKNGSKPISFHPYEFPYYKYIEYLEVYALLHFNNLVDTQIVDALEPKILFEVVANLDKKAMDPQSNRLFHELQEWKDAKEAGIHFAKIATLRAPNLPNASLLKEFFSIWVKTSKFESNISEIINQEMFDSENLYQIANFTREPTGDPSVSRVKYLRLFIKAMTTDLTVIESLKRTQPNKGATIREHEERVAIRYLDLVRFFKNYRKTAKDCLITAFSVYPCQKLFSFLFPGDLSDSGNVVTSDDGENSSKTSADYDDIQSMELDKECDMNKEDDLGLGEDLTDQLATLIHKPRCKEFVKINSNEELRKVCLKLLDCKSVAVIENRRLDFAKIDLGENDDFEKSDKIASVPLSEHPWLPNSASGGFYTDFFNTFIRDKEPPYNLQ